MKVSDLIEANERYDILNCDIVLLANNQEFDLKYFIRYTDKKVVVKLNL